MNIKIREKDFEGKSIDAAFEEAVKFFGVTPEEINFEVIQQPKKGFLGIGNKPAIINAFLNEKYMINRLNEFLGDILENFDGDFDYSINFQGKNILVRLEGDGLGKLIGKYGRTIGAMQHILSIFVNRLSSTKIDVNLDVGEYRRKKKEKIYEIVDNAVKRLNETNDKIELAPMFSYERRIVHEYVRSKYPHLETESIGLEPYRKVIIKSVKSKIKA
ncbi:single-stranded DNA-binding protein [Marinitoga sp. 1135]|uniref:Putative RNA-binding protein n=1 Tax=Marinitoga piezophila (strain DSM 14283 / JCM 11233 / KA3) TaxID=443254 RepID=H2J6W8_MARPK|nr:MULTISPECIES: RNA-binding cell elongation regulator Jag/EloR [Marinitoga]AEX85233.1 putative RNA-binding protein [Marinitoga piezophila KA3]APT75723.1 single-stranded DNA-binding protein [Marinitoga sp. 1137]NUU95460.1 single-stranded DNA-binding protein [Marinitoga sp. 1135]NUU97388.1 single-stranded DNA-binding protein [Marinitoga sp. 1138]